MGDRGDAGARTIEKMNREREPVPRRIRRGRGRWQFRLGVTLVVLSVVLLAAVGTAAWFYLSFSASVSAANDRIDAETRGALETPPPTTLVTEPQPTGDTSTTTPAQTPGVVMNMLVLGTDARPGEVEPPGSSDVIILLHIDTSRDCLSILSITRDLWVHIPGYGDDRINAAYYRGGPAKTIETLKSALGIDVTTYIGMGFENFPDLIDRLGGVYIDVDRWYTGTDWPSDLSPGYQLLDGDTAFLYSRYRYDENADFGRMARQQRLLAGLRDQARAWDKKLKLPGMVNALMATSATNLSADEMLRLAYWLTKLDGRRMKQIIIRGPGRMIDGKAVVVVDQATLAAAVADFLSPPAEESGAIGESGHVITTGRTPLLAAADGIFRLAQARQPAESVPIRLAGDPGATGAEQPILDAAEWQEAQDDIPFPLEAPTYLPPGFSYAGKVPESGGTYGIKTGGETKPGVRMLYRYQESDEYLGVSATTWLDAPLAGEGMTADSHGVTYTVVGTLGKASHVWWKRDQVLYWVSNTLMYALSEKQLLEIAESMRPVGAAPAQ